MSAAKAAGDAEPLGQKAAQAGLPTREQPKSPRPARSQYETADVKLFEGDALDLYDSWDPPVVIVVDGPYGVRGFPGDPPTPDALAKWYEPHVAAWSRRALPETTLWFWNTEIGWANVHPVLERFGWRYRNSHVWDKGMGHAAGNSNTQTLRKFPPVTELCVQYVRETLLPTPDAGLLTIKDWLRHEWERSGLPFEKTNEAAGVVNAATRKYFTKDWLWYFPPAEMFSRFSEYANLHGKPSGRPYFSQDGVRPISREEWGHLRAKFHCELGVTNVWREPALHGSERVKVEGKSLHLNQKPVLFMERIIKASSDPGDVVWEPFGGLCSAAVGAIHLGRKCFVAETNPGYFRAASRRLAGETQRMKRVSLDEFSSGAPRP